MFLCRTLVNVDIDCFVEVTSLCRLPSGNFVPAEEVLVSTSPDDTDPVAHGLGARIRSLRQSRGLTLTQLATRAGLSHPFLSKLERGLARPSMASLAQIALALGTSQVELLAGRADDVVPNQAPTEVLRAGEGVTGPYGLGWTRLLAGGRRRFQPMEFEGENTDPGAYFLHAEDEFLLVVSGIVRVDMAEQGSVTLDTGDSLYLDGGVPHRWCAAVPGRFRLFVVKERPDRR
jgi:transcriptional regulator with XRE-family HTH domain